VKNYVCVFDINAYNVKMCKNQTMFVLAHFCSGKCNYQCPGNKTEFCGNNLKCISLYKIDGLVNRRRLR
jgi:hypothetical protein